MIDELFIRAFRAHQIKGDLFHSDSHKAHEVFQMSTISALSQGLYDGEITYAQLAQHGDFGLGTFNGILSDKIRRESISCGWLTEGSLCSRYVFRPHSQILVGRRNRL